MGFTSRTTRGAAMGTMFLLAIVVPGCASIELPARKGVPQLVGFGWSKRPPTKRGQVVQLVAPGLSFRLQEFTPGLSLGWHETTYFLPEASGETNALNTPIAFQTKIIGINVALWQIVFGFDRRFAIPLPAEGDDLVQSISYAETQPGNTVVEQKKFK